MLREVIREIICGSPDRVTLTFMNITPVCVRVVPCRGKQWRVVGMDVDEFRAETCALLRSFGYAVKCRYGEVETKISADIRHIMTDSERAFVHVTADGTRSLQVQVLSATSRPCTDVSEEVRVRVVPEWKPRENPDSEV